MTKVRLLLTKIQNHELDSLFAEIYGDETDEISRQRTRYLEALSEYLRLFGDDEVEIYSAPGRTEICGNHTDHQHGHVLAASINLDVIAVVGKKTSPIVDFVSEGYAPIHCDLSDLTIRKSEKGTPTALIKGVIKGLQDHHYQTGSFKAYVTSDVVSGSGLSSSAAFETILGTIQSGLFNQMNVSPIDIALIGQYAENDYFGKPCGLMDQLACSVGDFAHFNFGIPKKPLIEKINFDLLAEGYCLCMVNTKGSHANLTEEYAAIPLEMKQVANYFDKDYLNEISFDDFIHALPDLYGIVPDRAVLRAYHFLSENERVKKAAVALKEQQFQRFLSLIRESGNSSFKYLQNVYSDKHLEQQPIPIALSLSESFLQNDGACRIHGGGFAGTILAFVPTERMDDYKKHMERILGNDTCHVLRIRKQGGIKIQ